LAKVVKPRRVSKPGLFTLCEESNHSFASETAPQAGKTPLRLTVAERGAPPSRTARPVVGLRGVLSDPVGLLRIVSEPNERLDSDVHE
jgi:hypothetical protein